MKVKYLGARVPRVFPLPLPLLSLSSKTGELRCEELGQILEVEAKQARSMCETFPELFELVSEKTDKKPMKSGD